MRAGAHDYVLKDKLTRLAPAVEREVREAAERAERRLADAAGKVHAARFNAMIEKSVDPVMLVANDGIVMYASPASARIYGRPVAELVGRHSADFMFDADREAVRQLLGVGRYEQDAHGKRRAWRDPIPLAQAPRRVTVSLASAPSLRL